METSDWKQAKQPKGQLARDCFMSGTETDLIHDFTKIPVIFVCALGLMG